jgi:hypothetical protein
MIKIFSFVKDEADKIQDWIKYHSYIVGIENIFIVDHMSTDGTYEILQKWKGLNLIRSNVPFHKKSEVLSSCMKKQIGFLIPLDADEFLCYKSNDIVCEATLIKNYISKLPIGSYRYKFHQLDVIPKETKVNDPLIELTEFKTKWYNDWQLYAKTFYHSSTFISTDQGNHKGSVVGRGDNYITDLVIIHFDVYDYDHFCKKVIRGATSYGHINNRQLISSKGKHYHRRYWAIKDGKGLEIMRSEFGSVGIFKTNSLSKKLKSLR